MKTLFALLLILISTTAEAADSRPFWYLDFSSSYGYSKVNAASSVSLNQIDLGTTTAIKIAFLYLGISEDYHFINQTSTVSSTVGNYSGSRFSILSPTVLFPVKNFLLKFDYQFIGNYKLSKPTADGADLSYQRPSGFSAALMYGMFHKQNVGTLNLGIQYESISFGSEQVSKASTDMSLSPSLKLWQVGLVAAFAIDF